MSVEVVFVGDLAVLVFGGLVGAVGVEPLFGGGVALVGVGVDAAGGEFVAGALFGGAGVGGVGVPAGADVVGLVELGGLPVEHVGQRGGLGGLAVQLRAAGLVGFVGGFGGAQLGGGAVALGGLQGAGQFGGDVVGCPGFFALVGADADAELPVAHLGFGAAASSRSERTPGGAPGRVGLDLALFRRAG